MRTALLKPCPSTVLSTNGEIKFKSGGQEGPPHTSTGEDARAYHDRETAEVGGQWKSTRHSWNPTREKQVPRHSSPRERGCGRLGMTKLSGVYSSPSSFHFLSTSALVFSSIRISSGQGRVKPSLGHLRVASMPIFDP